MADNMIESASSSSIQQPPTSTSHLSSINPVTIPLLSTGYLTESSNRNLQSGGSAAASSSSQSSSIESDSSSSAGGGVGVGVVGNSITINSPQSGTLIAPSSSAPISSSGAGGISTTSAPGITIGSGSNNNSSGSSHNNNNNNNNNSNSAGPNIMNSMITKMDEDEPEAKRAKLSGGASTTGKPAQYEKLEYRLGGILCCAVCLDLPKTAMYQCQMGHLMCAACFTHLLADGRLRDQVATCPNCRVEISKSTASRNLAVEKAASELPSECQYCNKEFPSKSLERHEKQECQERPTECKYSRIGCQWRGPNHEAVEHEMNCSHPKKSGDEIMAALRVYDQKYEKERKLFSTLIDLLSYEKIIFNDLQLKPYRTDEYIHNLFYETSRFSAFNHQWVVKARINNSQRNPHQSNERQITYQLILKTMTSTPLSIHFFALKGPFSDMKINTQIYKHDFTDKNNESEYNLLPLPDSSECNRLLASKAINFRLLMFLLPK